MRKFILSLGVAGMLASAAGAQTGNIGIGSSVNGSRLTLGGSFAGAFRSSTSSTILTTSDYFLHYIGSATGTITLPLSQTGAANFKGRVYKIRNGSALPLIITASGSEGIDGNLSISIAAGHSAELISNGATTGTTWKIVSAGPSTYSADGLRTALAAAGCTSCAAYDAAASGSWVNVTGAEYTALQSLSGSGAYGVSSANMATTPSTNWSPDYTVTQQFANTTQVPASSYVYAFSVRSGSTAPSTIAGMKLKLSNTSQTSGYATYPTVSAATPGLASGSPAATTLYYFVLKTPSVTSAPGAASNMAIYIAQARQVGGLPTTGTHYYAIGDVAAPATTFSNSMLLFQVLATPNLQW